MLVIGGHYVADLFRPVTGIDLGVASWPVFRWSWSGVDLFFVLSGYLIGRQLWREYQGTRSIRFGRFILRRGFRIWPLYFAFMLFLVVTRGPVLHWPDWVFASNYARGGYQRGWSLSTEEQFYIVVPIAILLLGRVLKLRHFPWVLGLAATSVVAARAHALQTSGMVLGDGEPLPVAIFDAFHLHCDALIAGLSLALASVIRPALFRPQRPGVIAWKGLAFAVLGCTTGLLLWKLDRHVFSFTALALIFGSITAWVLVDRSWLTRPLHARIFYPISRLSYGMYLNHLMIAPWVLAGLITFLQQTFHRPLLTFFVGLTASISLSIAVAVVFFVAVESPGLRLRERVLSDKRKRGAASAVETNPLMAGRATGIPAG